MSYPYFPFYVREYDGRTAHLSLAEDGAYNRLLRLCWCTPGCSVPNDPKWIMRRMRVTEDQFEAIVRPIIEEFFTENDDKKDRRIYSEWLQSEWHKTDQAYKKRKEAGRKGGKAKSLKNNETDSSNAQAIRVKTRVRVRDGLIDTSEGKDSTGLEREKKGPFKVVKGGQS